MSTIRRAEVGTESGPHGNSSDTLKNRIPARLASLTSAQSLSSRIVKYHIDTFQKKTDSDDCRELRILGQNDRQTRLPRQQPVKASQLRAAAVI